MDCRVINLEEARRERWERGVRKVVDRALIGLSEDHKAIMLANAERYLLKNFPRFKRGEAERSS